MHSGRADGSYQDIDIYYNHDTGILYTDDGQTLGVFSDKIKAELFLESLGNVELQ
jgi:hypothetical protein